MALAWPRGSDQVPRKSAFVDQDQMDRSTRRYWGRRPLAGTGLGRWPLAGIGFTGVSPVVWEPKEPSRPGSRPA